MRNRQGILIILSSPSGAGKSTLARSLRDWDPTIVFSVSATTREPRPSEVEGREYFFRSRKAFERMVENEQMLEHAVVFDHLYGTPILPVAEAIAAGNDVLFDIDWQGGQQIRNSALGNDVVSIFILPPSIRELEARLMTRGQDSSSTIQDRMAQSQAEISHWAEYDYVLVNDDLEATKKDVQAILLAERLKRIRQPKLTEIVRQLNAEFEERK